MWGLPGATWHWKETKTNSFRAFGRSTALPTPWFPASRSVREYTGFKQPRVGLGVVGALKKLIMNSDFQGQWREKAMETQSSTVAWKIPWMVEPGKLLSMGSLRVRHDWVTSLSLFNGNPLQWSCLENPRDGGAWWTVIYGVTQSWTWLSDLAVAGTMARPSFSQLWDPSPPLQFSSVAQ